MNATATLTRRSLGAALGGMALAQQAPRQRPNILWLVTEDIGPQIGAFGDRYANTPNLDKLAAAGVRYRYCWSNAPVCAPARTSIISGMYPPALGAEHMRSLVPMPPEIRMFPQYLREAGYYCSNNSKEDYNLEKPGQVWDDSSGHGHWRNRAPGQPFLAVFNFMITHESHVIGRRDTVIHDPSKAPLPAYYPDTPEVRRDVAQYYDNITTMDGQVASILRDLEADGLANNTIVFFYGDNGICLPRGKRMVYNSGLIVPFIVSVPEKFRNLAPSDYQAGGVSERLVSFVDLAPTVLSLAGIAAPGHMHGKAFLGEQIAPAPEHLFGFRGRMDERYDLMRATRDRRYIYIRNYMPHRIYGEHVAYQWRERSMQDWDRLHREGRLTPSQSHFWERKPYEELYDLTADRDEVKNLAGSRVHHGVLEKLRKAQDDWMREIRDTGLLPEPEMQSRSSGSTPYQMGRDPKRYAYENVKRAADMAAAGRTAETPQMVKSLADPDSGVRYWAATGLLIRGTKGVSEGAVALRKLLDDPSPSVRIASAEALGRYGTPEDQGRSLKVLLGLAALDRNGLYVSMLAWNSIDQLPVELLRPARAEIEAVDVGSELAAAAARGGRETVESRTGAQPRILKTTVLGKLTDRPGAGSRL